MIADSVLRRFAGEGSTRTVGLLRVLLPLVAWARWGYELLPFHAASGDRVALSVAFFVSTTWMLTGWFGRLGTLATAIVLCFMVYGYGRNFGVEDWMHHHTTLLANAVTLLALTPCSTSFSVDRWLALRRAARSGAPVPPERGPTWAIALVALQVSTLYFWSAFDKCDLEFLSGIRLEQIFVEVYWFSDVVTPGWTRVLFAVSAVVVVVVEFGLAFALWFPRARPAAMLVGVVLHALFYVLIPVSTFSVTMVALYLAFLDPDAFHGWMDRFLARPDPGPSAPTDGVTA